MNQFWQMSIALIMVLGAVWYIGLKTRTIFRQVRSGKQGSACGTSCGGCSAAKPNETRVDLQFPAQKLD
ncbi:MAG: hypothetical protein CMJ46_04355 [Planctomyces sp.]|nr:hypothetical protein [Planctomyces sp.]